MQGLERIRRVSRRFRLLFWGLLLLSPLAQVVYWALFPTLGYSTPDPVGALPFGAVSVPQRVIAFSVAMIPTAVVMYALYTLARLFSLYAQGRIFEADNVACYRRIGLSAFAWVAARLVFDAVIGPVLTYANPPGERQFLLSIDTSDISALVLGGLVLIIAWIMDEGRKLHEDQLGTI